MERHHYRSVGSVHGDTAAPPFPSPLFTIFCGGIISIEESCISIGASPSCLHMHKEPLLR